jgi:hypothetical protein
MPKDIIKRVFFLIINIVTVISVLGDNFFLDQLADIASLTIKIILILFTITYIAITIKEIIESNYVYGVKFGTKKFIEIFTKFYKNRGKLSICCKDLDWVTEEIFNALKEKSTDKKLDIFVVNKKDEKVQGLRLLGAEVIQMPILPIDRLRFSILEIDGSYTALLRSTDKDKDDSMKIEKTNDGNMTKTLQYILDSEKKKSKEK